MAKAQYSWPARDKTSIIGTREDRIDGIDKATGAARYAYDVNLPDMLFTRSLGCPHAHCRVRSIDTSAAEAVTGVAHVEVLEHAQPGSEIQWQGELLVVVAAETEAAAAEGVAALRVDYELLDVFVNSEDLEGAEKAGRTSAAGDRTQIEQEPGDDEDEDEFEEKEIARLFKESAHVVEGYFGIDVITHMCMETHGSTVYWAGDKLKAYLSTQNVSGSDDQFATALGVTADDVDVMCNYVGGGFGSKFSPDYWGIVAARISKKTGRPVKLMLSRDQELKIAGCRPSGYLKVRLGADKNGVVQIWDSHHWGTGGVTRGAVSQGVIPYVFSPKNFRRKATAIKTNTGGARAWRAPNHPQACAMSQTAYDELAGAMGIDSYDVFMRNLPSVSNGKEDVYAAEMKVGAKIMDWKAKWHAHGKGSARGSVVDGLGMALHTWGGGANASNCLLKIYQDGSVEAFCGTQDLGTGTRTICAMVLAETLGLKVDDVKIHIGSSTFPFSGGSGGSTTVGAVSESHRRAGQDALRKLFPLVATKLGASADSLEATGGRIQVEGNGSKSLGWKEACALLGVQPLEVTSQYQRGEQSPLSSSGVGGVQMAHVEVDKETGVVKVKKYVAVQDIGLVINPKTAESQIYGAAIMGIAYALYESRIMDSVNGDFLNAEMADYRLPRLGDTGEIVIHLYEPDSERDRGVVGLGEPPVISPGAAISNAVANALGTRVPVLPMTPKRVLDALNNARRA